MSDKNTCRLKADIEKKESEHEDVVARTSSKHASELSEIRYQLQDSETKRTDLSSEVKRLQARLSEQQQCSQDLQDQLSANSKSQQDAQDSRMKDALEENERLQEELSSVSSASPSIIDIKLAFLPNYKKSSTCNVSISDDLI